MGLILTNGQIGFFSSDGNQLHLLNSGLNPSVHGFLFTPKLDSYNPMNTAKGNRLLFSTVRNNICGIVHALPKRESENQLIDGVFLEKDFKFKPTFEGYLEAMEIARTGRDKNSIRDTKGHRSNEKGRSVGNNVAGRSISNGYEENVDLIDSDPGGEGNSFRNFDSIECDKHGDNEKTSDLYGNSTDTSRVLKRGKVIYRERDKDLKNERGLGVDGNLKFVKRNGWSGDLERRNLGYNANSAVEKKKMQQNGNWAKQPIGTVERKMGDTDIDKNILRREKFVRRMDQNKHKNFLEDNKLKICETETYIEWNNTHKDRNTAQRRDDAAEADQLSLDSTETWTRLGGNDFRAKQNIGANFFQKNKEFMKPNQALREEVEGDDLGMERKAFQSFEVFTDVRNRPRVLRMEMEARIQKLAKGLSGTNVNLPEWHFSKMMHSAKFKFTDHSILRLVQILGKLGNWRRALQVVQWLQSRERFKSYKSRYIYTTVLNVLGKARRPVEALNIFHAMREQLSSYPDMAAYHCIAVTLGQAGYMKELFDVIDCMKEVPEKLKKGTLEKWDPRLQPDAVVYNAVLNACVRRKQWEGAFWVLQQLKQQGIQPSTTTYGLVMEVMLACGKYNLVHDFFRKVEKSSIPSTLTYRVLVNALWREGKTDEAILAVQDMERRGIVGSASLYYDLARCLCSAGRCQEALVQVDKICKVAKKPLVVTYTGLIKTCVESGNVQDGAYVFNHMHKFCSPNLVTCNIMLRSYVAHKMFEEATDLFWKILDGSDGIGRKSHLRERVIPDHFTFSTMLVACAAGKRWDDFENIYRRMLHHGYHLNTRTHLWVILEASKAGKVQLLDTTWDHLVRSGRVLPSSIIKEMFCRKLQDGDVTAAISFISGQTNVQPNFSKEAWLDLFKSNSVRFQKETLDRLANEVSTLIAESDEPYSIFQNLANSCREIINTNILLDHEAKVQ